MKHSQKKKGLKNIFKDAVFLSIADAGTRGATGLLAILMARFLGPTLYGQYVIASSISMIMMTFTASGFEEEFTKKASIDHKTIPKYFVLNMIAITATCMIAYSLIMVTFFVGPYSDSIVKIGLVVGAGFVVRRYYQPFRQLCLIQNTTKIAAISQSFFTSLLVLGTLGIIYIYHQVLPIVIFQLFVYSLMIFSWYIWLPKKYLHYRPNREEVKTFFKNAIPFALSNVVWIVYFNFDTFILSLYHPEEVVGIYGGAFRICSLAYIVGYAVVSSYTPVLFREFHKHISDYFKTARKLVLTMIFLGVPVFLALFFGSFLLIPLLFGDKFHDAILLTRVLSFAVLLRFINFSLSEILMTSDNQVKRVYFEITLLSVNVILNFLLIPKFGGLGAALATISSEIIFLALAFRQFRVIKRHHAR